MAIRHSSRKRPSGRAGPRRPSPPAPEAPSPAASAAGWKRMARAAGKKALKPPDFDEILGHCSETLASVECAHSGVDAAQETAGVGRAIGAAVLTLERGVTELLRSYTELDHSIQRHREGGAS